MLEKNDNGVWTASCPVLPGCISEGATKDDALRHLMEAIHLYLSAIRKELPIANSL